MRVSALEGHRLWAPFYGHSGNPVLALERRSLANILSSLKPATVVDVACGTGYWLLHFQKQGATVFGVDFSSEMLGEATRFLLRGRVALGNAEFLPIRDEAADLVVCSMSLGYFPNLLGTFREFQRIAAAGACIAVSDLHPAAVSAGWTRSFTVGETHYEIEHYSPSLEDIDHAALAAGLCARHGETVYFGDSEYPIFEAHGKAERFLVVKETPALFLRTWEKQC